MMDKVLTIGLVLHFRTPEKTLCCLKSLWDEGIEVAVLVDNSADMGRSVGEMQAGLARLSREGMLIEVVGLGKNLGFSRGVNFGIEYIQRHFIGNVLLINSDAILRSDSYKNMLRELSGHDLVIPMVGCHEVAARVSGGYYHKYLGLYLMKPFVGAVFYPSGCCILINKTALRANFFNEDFFFYGEDVYLGYALSKRCGRIAVCRTALIYHEGSTSARNGSMFYEYNMVYGHWLLAKRLAENGLEIFLNIFLRCITLPIRALLRCIRSRSFLPLKALAMGMCDGLKGRVRDLTPPANI